MKHPAKHLPVVPRQTGAALIVGLILLVVVTVLAISGMNTATTELAIARNDQSSEYAFQAAEAGLDRALSRGIFNAEADEDEPPFTEEHAIASSGYSVATELSFVGTTIVPGDSAFSLSSGMSAYHFVAEAAAESTREATDDYIRDASAAHTQAFYVVGPGSSSL